MAVEAEVGAVSLRSRKHLEPREGRQDQSAGRSGRTSLRSEPPVCGTCKSSPKTSGYTHTRKMLMLVLTAVNVCPLTSQAPRTQEPG